MVVGATMVVGDAVVVRVTVSGLLPLDGLEVGLLPSTLTTDIDCGAGAGRRISSGRADERVRREVRKMVLEVTLRLCIIAVVVSR
jgi:hypothetical protein